MVTVGDPIAELVFFDAEGKSISLESFPQKYLHLVFIRHLACIACQGYLDRLKKRYADFQAKDCEILAVTMSKPASLAIYGKRVQWPFPMLCDPERKAYRYFELNEGSFWRIIKPIPMLNYLQLMLRGWLIRPPYKEESMLQLGGNFILNPARDVIYAHRCKDPADRPWTRTLLAAIPG